MVRKRISHKKKVSIKKPVQGTNLWNFFGRVWKRASAHEQEEEQKKVKLQQEKAEVQEVEDLTFSQISKGQQKTKLRLKR